MYVKGISLPKQLGFRHHGEVYDFDKVLSLFNWEFPGKKFQLDFSNCYRANYQALSLWVLYVWYLKSKKTNITFKLHEPIAGASQMWRKMGASGWYHVLTSTDINFNGSFDKPLLAIRNTNDFKSALQRVEEYTKEFNVEYNKTLRYVISELLYNTLEHGNHSNIPSIIQYNWYREKNEISFVIADLGIGIKRHLEQTYPPFDDDIEAIKYAIRPQVSGTFGKTNTMYQSKNNAGVGLFLSTSIIRKLNAHMHIISGNGVLHISPVDITENTLKSYWPGTLINVSIKLGKNDKFSLHSMMSEFRDAARREISMGENNEMQQNKYVNISNYFGRHAEVKDEAIRYRDKHLLPAVAEEKTLVLDFEGVESAPHSFISALIATPIQVFGMAAYKKIKVVNALPEIRETIDFILDENTN